MNFQNELEQFTIEYTNKNMEFQQEQAQFTALKKSHNHVKKIQRKKFLETKESLKETTISYKKYRDSSNSRNNQMKNRTNFLKQHEN